MDWTRLLEEDMVASSMAGGSPEVIYRLQLHHETFWKHTQSA